MFGDSGFAGDRMGEEQYEVSTGNAVTSFARLDEGMTARSKVDEVNGAVFGGDGISTTVCSKIP